MSKFFIDRPIFAWVVAIFIILAGALSLQRLPIEQYPSVSAPNINIQVVYPGASAAVIEESVLSLIEREMNGIEGLDYMSASASSQGGGSLSLTFKSGTNEDIAQVNVQNAISQVESRLPASVVQNGITVSKSNSSFLMAIALVNKEGGTLTRRELNDYAVRNIVPEIQRIEGVGNVQMFGSESSMRIWVEPDKLRGYDLSAMDVSQALAEQNRQISTGSLGALPALDGQQFSAVINIDSQLKTVEDFENVIIKSLPSGATVRLKDVARVELGLQEYGFQANVDGKIAAGIGVQLSNTGNAVATANAVKAKMAQLEQYFPSSMEWMTPYDTSLFVELSIKKVFMTLVEAMALVFLVMFLFLQNFRYTLIPSIVVPISLLGAFAVMYPLGLSINVLTMFAMVLVIGIVVDDAIVVVENVERLMVEERLTPYQATVKSMGQISSAIIGITLVNIIVFVPMSFLSGTTGMIYRQFALVISTSIAFSGLLALTLTPALCATILKPVSHDHHEKSGFFGWFNRFVKGVTHLYEASLAKIIRVSYATFVAFVAVSAGAVFIFLQLPKSFLPDEDQGVVFSMIQLPTGASAERTLDKLEEMNQIVKKIPEIDHFFAIQGFSFMGQGQNMGLTFIMLKDWSERVQPNQKASALIGQLMGRFMGVRDATIFAMSPPAIPSLGTSSGFDVVLEDRGGHGHEALLNARNMLLGMMMQNPALTGVRPSGVADGPQMRIDINRDAAYAQGVSLNSIASVLGTNFGSAYINDYPNAGRLQRVTVQADAGARMQEDDVKNLLIPNKTGGYIKLGSIATFHWYNGQMQADRYNGYPSMKISGSAAQGHSSGDAMRIVEGLAKKLPQGFAIEWTGMSLEEQRAGDQQAWVYGLTLLSVFLCLAALYESWSIPFAVLLVMPLGLFGTSLGIFGRNMFNISMTPAGMRPEIFANDIYFVVGMITVMGLVAKNAILIIEFAKEQQEAGLSRVQAALNAAHLRFRPIIMTSMAFILGVVPLYFATGASSASQRAIGTSVFWGMSIGTFLGLVMIPIFFVIVRKIFSGRHVKDKYAGVDITGNL